MEEKRMAGDYEIKSSVSVGCREIVMGENPAADTRERYMCAIAERNDLFVLYKEVMVSDDYLEIVALYAQRIGDEKEQLRREVDNLGIPITVITEADCIPDSCQNDINGKVIAIDSKVLKPEYQRADRQLYVVEGGFGAYANSRGSAVFCRNVYDGKTTRFERMDVMGEVKPECMPEWAKERLGNMNQPKKNRDYER